MIIASQTYTLYNHSKQQHLIDLLILLMLLENTVQNTKI